MEEMKCDHFYEGLNPKYQSMLVHKVDGENPAGYSNLLLATWKLERRAVAMDHLPQNTAATNGSNAIHSQTPGNIFPLHKLKGNHTFTTWAVTVENAKGEADSGSKQGGEGETEPLADKEAEASGRAEGTDQSIEYIVCFTKVVEHYQQQTRSCFRCGSPNHLIWDCPKHINKSAQKVDLNTKEGMAKKGGQTPQKPAVVQWASLKETP